MTYRINGLLRAVAEPPIAEAHGWIQGRSFPAEKKLIDVAQAVPGYPPPASLTTHLAEIAPQPQIARYTEIEGIPRLREALAGHMSQFYGARIEAAQVAITAGCNQGFCLAAMTLAAAGDEIILPLPYYFNHRMWLDMLGINSVLLPFRPDRGGVPDPDEAASLIGPKTRAIVLVSPNNPTGAVYPRETLAAFRDLAKARGIALVIDETYKDFLASDGPPHDLFAAKDWADTLIQLYSFSKVYCLTGYRVGAVLASPGFIAEMAKAMDCVAICAPRIGQEAALYGLEHLGDWRVEKRRLMSERVAALHQAFAGEDTGYEIVSAGAYFAYLRHPFAGTPARAVAKHLAEDENMLCLPGSMFGPGQEDYLRFAFANVETALMPEIARRLAHSARRNRF
ncbi:MAG: aminotransferase [Alphaproteobacteria bacterium]|nr:aminotransferase [Alphaproteobacteria bacterium]